jgi:hypothetical protein
MTMVPETLTLGRMCFQGDNTVRENRNQYVMLYSALLARRIRLAGLLFLRKSHTHDIIGRLV